MGRRPRGHRAANEALREFRMLASVIDRVDATTTDDGDLDRALGEMPERLATIERLQAAGFIPLLEPPAKCPRCIRDRRRPRRLERLDPL
jgi:hypothetical protein